VIYSKHWKRKFKRVKKPLKGYSKIHKLISAGSVLWLLIAGTLLAQMEDGDYPTWFLDPSNPDYVIGLAKNVSEVSVVLSNAYLDALALSVLASEGNIQTSEIGYLQKIADSLEIRLGSHFQLPENIKIIKSTIVADLFIGLFEITRNETDIIAEQPVAGVSKITAIGRQTLHPDRIYESWASAEIEAFKEVSKIKSSRVSSIVKKSGKKYERLIYLQSSTQLHQVRATRRWVKNNVCYVQVSENY